MKQVEGIPFTENALRRIAQIIGKRFRYEETVNIVGLSPLFDMHPNIRYVHEFFSRAGCSRDLIIYDGEKDTY